ncbi:MAG: hydroxyisourate hydrolase [Pseudomonadota bacterium]
MGKLTTHVLDTSQGIPGRAIPVRLFRIDESRTQVTEAVTNHDGRCDAPLLDADRFQRGTYELEFAVADYFREQPIPTSEPPYLDLVTLRVTLTDDAHYHVPLLVSPWSYSTYRGS